MIQTFATLLSKEQYSDTIFLLTLHAPEIAATARAGQFINIRIDSGTSPLLRRPFSISWVEKNSIEILIQVVGTGSKMLIQKNVGDLIDVIGPLGNSFRIDGDFTTAILVGGGVWVAPLPFLTKELIEKQKTVYTFVGFRSKELLYTKNLKNVTVATDDGSEGMQGNVVELVNSYLNSNSVQNAKIFSCGPTAMLRALTSLAYEKRICCEVSLEGEMACGVGLCQGCPIELKNAAKKYALVCKEGPNFLADEIQL